MCHAAEHYGFVLDDNPHDAALLPVGALPDDQLQGSIQPRECWLHPCGTPSWGLLRALRTWAATFMRSWVRLQPSTKVPPCHSKDILHT